MGSTSVAFIFATTAVVIMGIGAVSDIPPEAKKLLKELEKDFPDLKGEVDKRGGAMIEEAGVISKNLDKSRKDVDKMANDGASLREDLKSRLDKDSARVKRLEKILNVTKAALETGRKAASVGDIPPEAKKLLKELDKGTIDLKDFVDKKERILEKKSRVLSKHLQNAKKEIDVIEQGGKKMRKFLDGHLDTDLAKVKRLEKILNVTTSAAATEGENGSV